jgi:hypothetical protein
MDEIAAGQRDVVANLRWFRMGMHGSATYPVALLCENCNAKHHPISVSE